MLTYSFDNISGQGSQGSENSQGPPGRMEGKLRRSLREGLGNTSSGREGEGDCKNEGGAM